MQFCFPTGSFSLSLVLLSYSFCSVLHWIVSLWFVFFPDLAASFFSAQIGLRLFIPCFTICLCFAWFGNVILARSLIYNCLRHVNYLFVFCLLWQRHLGAYFSVFDCFMPCLLFDCVLPDLATSFERHSWPPVWCILVQVVPYVCYFLARYASQYFSIFCMSLFSTFLLLTFSLLFFSRCFTIRDYAWSEFLGRSIFAQDCSWPYRLAVRFPGLLPPYRNTDLVGWSGVTGQLQRSAFKLFR